MKEVPVTYDGQLLANFKVDPDETLYNFWRRVMQLRKYRDMPSYMTFSTDVILGSGDKFNLCDEHPFRHDQHTIGIYINDTYKHIYYNYDMPISQYWYNNIQEIRLV